MSKRKIEILAAAWRELEEIAQYHLLMVGPISAKKITDRLLDAIERLEEFPLSSPHVADSELQSQDYRMLICEKYVCIYRLLCDTVFIYHIAHTSTEYTNLMK